MKQLSDYHRNRRIERQLKVAFILALSLCILYLLLKAIQSGY